jgi:CHAD domain-containing protein
MEVGVYWLKVNEPAARDGDVEGVHHLRTTTRRLRTALGLFRDLCDSSWADRLADELKWLAHTLGAVRDLDVLRERLDRAARGAGLIDELDPLFEGLDRRHGEATAAMLDALRGDRYRHLAEALSDSVGAVPSTEAASASCREALPPLVAAAWRRLKQGGRSLRPDSPDEEFHEVRKEAKRARYAAEAVAGALDPSDSEGASRFARRARKVQDFLGEHQDAVVAASVIRRAAADHPDLGPFNFAAGRLLEHTLRDAEGSRCEFFSLWPRLDRRKVVGWLKEK